MPQAREGDGLAAGPPHPPLQRPWGKLSLARLLRHCLTKAPNISSREPVQPGCSVRSRLLPRHLSESLEDAQEVDTPQKGWNIHGSFPPTPTPPSPRPLNQELEAQTPEEAERLASKVPPLTSTECL